MGLDLRGGGRWRYEKQARSKQIITGQARKWAGQRGVSGSNYIASLKIQVMSSLLTRQPV